MEKKVYTTSVKCIYVQIMPVKMTSIRLDTRLADEAAKTLGVKSRTEAVHTALKEVVALKRFKRLMSRNAGKLSFADYDK
jgi:Arc/MetJ family transcription regulator